MKLRLLLWPTIILLATAFATAQVPCGPTIIPNATLFVNWPQLAYDSAHSSCNPYEKILSSSTVRKLVLNWQYPSNGTVTPVIANGAAYISDQQGTLYAINASTGATLWTHSFGTGQTSFVPAVANGIVYVAYFEEFDQNTGLYAFDAKTGDLLWKNGEGNISPLTTANGNLYYAGPGPGVTARNAKTGQFLWFTQASDYLAQPVVANGMVYTASTFGGIYAMDAATGAPVWTDQTGTQTELGPVANGLVYADAYTTFGTLYAFDAKTGALVWKDTKFGRATSVATGVLYALHDADQSLYALNARTGVVIWKSADPAAGWATVANGIVYSSAFQQVFALNAKTGATLWNYPTTTDTYFNAAVVNGKLYVGTYSGLLAFDLPEE